MVIESDTPEKEGSFCLCLFLAHHVFCKDQNCLETKIVKAHTQCVFGITICTLQSTNPGGYLGSRLVGPFHGVSTSPHGYSWASQIHHLKIGFHSFFFFSPIGSR